MTRSLEQVPRRTGPGGTQFLEPPSPDRRVQRDLEKTLFLCSPPPGAVEPRPILQIGNGATEQGPIPAQQAVRPVGEGPAAELTTIAKLIARPPASKPAAGQKVAPFRQQALCARYEEIHADPLPEVTGSRWTALLLLGSLVVLLSAVAYFGHVEVTSKAMGSLRVAAGPTAITVQASGVVANLRVKAGDAVEAEQQIASIEAKELKARVDRTSQQVELLREETRKARSATETLQQKSIQALEHKRNLLWQRAKLKQAQVTARRGHAERVRELARQGAASEFDALTANEAASAADEELLSLRQQVAEIGVQIADRKHAYGTERIEREFQVREAEVGLAEAETMAVLAQVRAPEAGTVESLLVSEGEVVQAGATVARIIPDGKASSAVVFAPATDAAFLRSGLRASLEFPSLPVSEYGKAQATVARVGNDLAVPAEIRSVPGADLSAQEGLVRVELSVVENRAWSMMQPHLHSGAPVVARIETRRRRIITLVFDFLRSWYPDS